MINRTLITNIKASFTRPADTTAYTAGDLVANSTTAGAVVPLTFTRSPTIGNLFIRRLRFYKSGTSITNASFRLHLFRAAPTFTAGDNATAAGSGILNHIGAFDVTMTGALSDGSFGVGLPVTGTEIGVEGGGLPALYGAVQAMAAYTPASAEVFTAVLEAHRY